jgi:hypothetical protein
MESHLNEGNIVATLDLPPHFGAATKLRLRTPGERKMKSVLVDGKPWAGFDAAEETITIPPGSFGKVRIVAAY